MKKYLTIPVTTKYVQKSRRLWSLWKKNLKCYLPTSMALQEFVLIYGMILIEFKANRAMLMLDNLSKKQADKFNRRAKVINTSMDRTNRMNRTIVNLSNIKLDSTSISLQNNGLNFTIAHQRIQYKETFTTV